MICTNCGNEIEQGAKFCTACGTKVESVEKIDTNVSENTGKNTATVTFKCQTGFMGRLSNTMIYVDNSLIAKLKDKESQQIELSYGYHRVIFDMWFATSECVINITSDYPKIEITIGILISDAENKRVRIRNIKDEQGKSCMRDIILERNKLSEEYTLFEDEEPQERKMDKQAVFGFIIAILGMACCYISGIAGMICALIAIYMECFSLNRLKIMKNRKGKVLAIVALIFGLVVLLLSLFQTINY